MITLIGRAITLKRDEKDSNILVVTPTNLLPDADGDISEAMNAVIQANKTVIANAIITSPYLTKQYKAYAGEEVLLYRDIGHDGEIYYWTPTEHFGHRKDTELDYIFPAKKHADDEVTDANTYRVKFDTATGILALVSGTDLKEKVLYKLGVSFKDGVLQFITDTGDELTWDNVSRIFKLVSKEATLEMDTVIVTNDLKVGNDLTVGNDITVGGNATVDKSMNVGDSLNVTNSIKSNSMNTKSLTTATGTVTGAFSIGGALTVVGPVTAAKGNFASGPYT